MRSSTGSVPSSGGNLCASSLSSTTAWTLPQPWTEEHRPPLLGNHTTGFHQRPRQSSLRHRRQEFLRAG